VSGGLAAVQPMEVDVLGVALWTDAMPSWSQAQAVLRGDAAPIEGVQPRPVAGLLSAAERRRAPDSVALALHVAQAALDDAGLAAKQMPSVFASAHGDMAVTDYLCQTLASDPSNLSPTKFIQTVHNVVSGQWGIATGCRAPSTAVSAAEHTFGAGLLEAFTQTLVGQAPLLWVNYEVPSVGTLKQLTPSQGRMALAMVLAPTTGAAGMGEGAAVSPKKSPQYRLGLQTVIDTLPGELDHGHQTLSAKLGLKANPLSVALPCLAAMAQRRHACMHAQLGPRSVLKLDVRPLP
jgi:hypothetical protein